MTPSTVDRFEPVLRSGAICTEGWQGLSDGPGCRRFLGLPGLHQLSCQLTQLIGILRGVECSVELFDLEALLGGELDAAVHEDLQWGVHARYRDEPNVLLQIALLLKNFRESSPNGELACFGSVSETRLQCEKLRWQSLHCISELIDLLAGAMHLKLCEFANLENRLELLRNIL